MYNQLLISLQIEEKWYTFRLFFGILSCYYLHIEFTLFNLFACFLTVNQLRTFNS